MRKVIRALRKIPLFLLLLLVGAGVSGIAVYGKDTLYAGEEWDWKTEPYFVVVLRGIQEGIYPWEPAGAAEEAEVQDAALQALLEQAQQAAQSNTGQAQQDGSGEAGGQSGAGTDDVANGASGGDVSGNTAAGLDVSGNDVSDNDVSGNDVSGNDVSGNHAAGTEGGASAGEQSGDGGSAQNPEDAGAAGSGGSGEEDAQLSEEEKAKRENETYVHADSMPEGVNNEVVGAVDYGNADQRFLSPEGTAYNEDTAGLFAQNGDYYRFRSVDEVYFSDAIFIGDSRTVGLYDYGGLQGKTTFLAKESISVYNMYERKLDLYEPGAQTQSKTVLEALMTKQYRKVYLSVGVNELGIPDTKEYYQKYREAVAVIRQLQPDAIIYIEGIMHVTEKKSKSDSVFNNTNIVQRNNAIATLANGHDIFYIDMNTAVCDEDGNLRSDLTADGVHLKGSAYALWYDFLLQNAIVRDGNDYLGTGPTEGGVDLSSLQTAQ